MPFLLQGLGFSLSTLFCWVIWCGVLQRLHSPEVPEDNVQGAFRVTLSFSIHFHLTESGSHWDAALLFP